MVLVSYGQTTLINLKNSGRLTRPYLTTSFRFSGRAFSISQLKTCRRSSRKGQGIHSRRRDL